MVTICYGIARWLFPPQAVPLSPGERLELAQRRIEFLALAVGMAWTLARGVPTRLRLYIASNDCGETRRGAWLRRRVCLFAGARPVSKHYYITMWLR